MPTSTFVYEGKRYYVRGDTQKERNEKIKKKKAELRGENKKTTPQFKEWSVYCIETYKRSCKPTTYKGYFEKIGRLNNVLGDKYLQDITPIDCQRLLNNLHGYSQYVIDQSVILLKFIFQRAIDNGIIEKILRSISLSLEALKLNAGHCRRMNAPLSSKPFKIHNI